LILLENLTSADLAPPGRNISLDVAKAEESTEMNRPAFVRFTVNDQGLHRIPP
jgi:hypothetical protein